MVIKSVMIGSTKYRLVEIDETFNTEKMEGGEIAYSRKFSEYKKAELHFMNMIAEGLNDYFEEEVIN